jgi:hypothetical protein
MKVTRQIVADKIADYLHGKLSQIELVDWAERAMMNAEFGLRWQAFGREPNFTEGGAERERVRLGNPGNRDSGELSISDCEEFLRRLGYRAKVIVSSV